MTSELRNKLTELFGEDLFPEIFNLLNASAKDGSFVIHGKPEKPEILSAATMLNVAPKERRQCWFVKSAGGAQEQTSNPQIAPGTFIGQELLLVGVSDVDIVKFHDDDGIKSNGAIELDDGQTALLFWTGSVWSESSRR